MREPLEQQEPDQSVAAHEAEPERIRWRLPLLLFVLTVCSTFYIGVTSYVGTDFPSASVQTALQQGAWLRGAGEALRWLARGWQYAVPLLAILLCHEFGHYLMARRHRVPVSLPLFIPVPVPPFGTMGAVIKMRGRIRTRDALLDIGAAGPLAGLLVAIPVTFVGLLLSTVQPIERQGAWTQEGTSLLYGLLKFLAKGPIPADHDVFLHPVAMAGWVGLFVTMINLIPYGQLDGGHVAYSLLQRLHDRYARFILWVLVALGIGTGLYWGLLLSRESRDPWQFGSGYTQGFNWFVFAFLIWALHRGTGGRHPPTDPSTLSPARRLVAIVTLALFGLLFMPVPLRIEDFSP
jgi:membrane-associated protease RseP (regulator of RpoE activity)